MFDKFLFSIFLTLSFISSLNAQPLHKDQKSNYLHIGDTIPDFTFNISNYKTKSAKMSDFRGKPVILDLWGVFCSSCISGMPHMEELQKQFGDSVQIILVTRDAPEKVASLKKRSEILKTVQLPSIVGDNTPAKYFDYTFVPQHIWIDKNGIIKAIANSEDANATNIRQFIQAGISNIREKNDLMVNHEIPLINFWYPYYKMIGLYGYITRKPNNYNTAHVYLSLNYNPDQQQYRMANTGVTMPNLFIEIFINKLHLNNPLNVSYDRIICNMHGSRSVYFNDSSKVQFIYDLIADSSFNQKELYKYMQVQLNCYLHAHSYVSSVSKPSYILKIDKSKLKINNSLSAPYSEKSLKIYSAKNVEWRWILI